MRMSDPDKPTAERLTAYLRIERDNIEHALRIRHADIALLNARLAQINAQIEKYEMER